MTVDDIQDVKLGSSQVSAIYLGDDLIWPRIPLHYVITDAWLVYSAGSIIYANGSNYAYALGTVRVQRGTTIINTLYNQPLSLSVNSEDFFVTQVEGVDHAVIKGYDLAGNETSAIKSAEVTVSFRDATPQVVGNVQQQINSYTEVTNEWTEWDAEPTTAPRPITGSYWVTLALSRYNSASAQPCPAYGGTATLYAYAGHQEANFSYTGWVKLQTKTRTYTSGTVITSTPVVIDSGTTTPEQVGNAWSVDDTPTLNTLPDWLSLVGTSLTIDTEGTSRYNNGRNFTIVASNGSASPASVTVYQQENVPTNDYIYDTVFEDSYIIPENSNYQISASAGSYASQANAAPASGNVSSSITVSAWHIAVDVTYTPYTIYETPHWVWTSGEETYGTRTEYYSDTDVARGLARRQTDSVPTPSITMYNRGGSGAPGFSWRSNNNTIYIPSEDVFEYQNGRYAEATFTNGDASATVTLYQSANVIVSTDPNTTREWSESYTRTVSSGYAVTLYAPNYTTPALAAPASGATVALSAAGYHMDTVTLYEPWTDVSRPQYTWSSGATNYGDATIIDSGTRETIQSTTQVTDIPTVALVSGTGFTYDDGYVTIASEGTSYLPSGRSATFRATNGDATPAEVTLYQLPNTYTTSYVYDLAVEIQQSGNIPAAGGTLYVTYRSFRTPTRTYSSGESQQLASEAYTSTVSGENCIPSTTQVSGENALTITVGANTSTTQTRTVIVTLRANASNYVLSQKVQDMATPSVQKVATFKPYMFPNNMGPYIKGKVYYQFLIVSGTLTSGTLTGVNFHYQVNGGTRQTIQIGTFEASEHNDPTAFEPQGITIPTFTSGTIKCWFEVTGNKGGFDTINANDTDPNYYSEVTLLN